MEHPLTTGGVIDSLTGGAPVEPLMLQHPTLLLLTLKPLAVTLMRLRRRRTLVFQATKSLKRTPL